MGADIREAAKLALVEDHDAIRDTIEVVRDKCQGDDAVVAATFVRSSGRLAHGFVGLRRHGAGWRAADGSWTSGARVVPADAIWTTSGGWNSGPVEAAEGASPLEVPAQGLSGGWVSEPATRVIRVTDPTGRVEEDTTRLDERFGPAPCDQPTDDLADGPTCRTACSRSSTLISVRRFAHRNVRRATTLESWSATTTVCFLSARSIPTIAFDSGTASRSFVSRAFLLRSPLETPLPLVMNVPLMRWDTKPDKRIRRTFLRPASTRRTSFYAAQRRSRAPTRIR